MICAGIKKIHHIGYLVKDISGAVETFKTLGFLQENEIFEDDGRKASFCFLVSGGTRIELVSPHKDSDLYPLLKKYRNSPYHICLEVDDIAKEKEELSMCSPGGGWLSFLEAASAPAISPHAEVAFLMNSDIGMVELVEFKTDR